MWAISCTARSNASSLALEGFVAPLILRTYCRAAACTSSSFAAGSKLWRVWMFRHMPTRLAASTVARLGCIGGHVAELDPAAVLSRTDFDMRAARFRKSEKDLKPSDFSLKDGSIRSI